MVQALEFFCKTLRAASAEVATGADLSKAPAELTSEAENAATATTTMSSILGWAMTSTSSSKAPAAAGAPHPGGVSSHTHTPTKSPGSGPASERDSYSMAQPNGPSEHRGVFAQQANGGAFGGTEKGESWDDRADDGDGWGDLDLMDDDFNGGLAAGSKRDTNGGGSSQFGTPVTTFSGGSRGSTDIASLDVKVSEGALAAAFDLK